MLRDIQCSFNGTLNSLMEVGFLTWPIEQSYSFMLFKSNAQVESFHLFIKKSEAGEGRWGCRGRHLSCLLQELKSWAEGCGDRRSGCPRRHMQELLKTRSGAQTQRWWNHWCTSVLSKGGFPTVCSWYHIPVHPRSTYFLNMCSQLPLKTDNHSRKLKLLSFPWRRVHKPETAVWVFLIL